MEKKAVQQEKEYLQSVYQELLEARQEKEAAISVTNDTARQTLNDSNEEIRLNFDSYLDNLDTIQ